MIDMKKVFELSYGIDGYDSDLVEMMETFGTITLIDTVLHPIPVWADEYYIPRQTLTYEWDIHPQYEKLATNLYNLAFGNDLLN